LAVAVQERQVKLGQPQEMILYLAPLRHLVAAVVVHI
jgi:hypothetical protein